MVARPIPVARSITEFRVLRAVASSRPPTARPMTAMVPAVNAPNTLNSDHSKTPEICIEASAVSEY